MNLIKPGKSVIIDKQRDSYLITVVWHSAVQEIHI